MAVGDRADHGPDVSAVHFLHDYRSEDDGDVRKRGSAWWSFLVALVEMLLRLEQVVYAPFYALFIVGPAAMLVEIWLDSRRERAAKAVAT